jgi:hypothetical protein
LAAYDQLRHQLADELGVDPSRPSGSFTSRCWPTTRRWRGLRRRHLRPRRGRPNRNLRRNPLLSRLPAVDDRGCARGGSSLPSSSRSWPRPE